MSGGGEQTRIRKGQSLLEGEQSAALQSILLFERITSWPHLSRVRKIHPGITKCFTILQTA